MKSIEYVKRILEDNKAILKDKYKVIEIGIFGSYVRGEATLTSDIDILVDFEQEGKTFDNYIELKYFLEELLGIKVDLVMKGVLKQELRDIILKETVYV
jgi:predicted nucleotidyltransferase